MLTFLASAAPAIELDAEQQALIHKIGQSLGAGGNPDAWREFFGSLPIKSATSELTSIRLLSQQLGLSGQDAYQEPRPSEACPETYGSPGGHFLIHYALTGAHTPYEVDSDSDGDGIPDYIESVALIMDSVYAKTNSEMGYRTPPDDSFYADGLDSRYDVYIADLKTINTSYENIYGFTQPEAAAGSEQFYTSFLVLDNDYAEIEYYAEKPLDAIRVTAAHEYTHACQFAYDTYEFEALTSTVQRHHWFEMSAVWMEEQHYDDINDYYFYLPIFFNNTHRSLRTSSTTGIVENTYQYAAVVWPLYLSQKYGQDVIRLIWEECAEEMGPDVFVDGFDNIIKQVSSNESSFWEDLSEFYVWAYFTGTRAVPNFGWEEAENYSMIPSSISSAPLDTTHIQSYSEFPVEYRSDDKSYEFYPDYLGANYLRFQTYRLDSTLTVDFDGVNSMEYGRYLGNIIGEIPFQWIVRVVGVNFDLGARRIDLDETLYADGDSIVIDDIDLYSEVVVIPIPVTSTLTEYIYDDITYNFDVPETSRPLSSSITFYDPYPNPLILSEDGSTIFKIEQELQNPLELTVFTLAGEKVYEGKAEGTAFIDWKGENQSGERVASGMYLVHIKVGDDSEVFKVAVIE